MTKFELQVQEVKLDLNTGTTVKLINPLTKVPLFSKPKALTVHTQLIVAVDLYDYVTVEVHPKLGTITLSTGGIDYGEVKVI